MSLVAAEGGVLRGLINASRIVSRHRTMVLGTAGGHGEAIGINETELFLTWQGLIV